MDCIQKHIIKSIAYLTIFFASAYSISSFAHTFNVVPDRALPQTVPEFGQTSAYYKVTNTTTTDMLGNFVRQLPPNVTQVTCDAKYCGATFNLTANGTASDSCILKLTIKQPVVASAADLVICNANESDCDQTLSPLNVGLGPSLPFIAIAAGSYSNHTGGIFPLLAKTNDSGATWVYPTEIFQDLKNRIDPTFENGVLSAAACSANGGDSNVCIAPGEWCRGDFCDNGLPLIAVGTHGTQTWAYPKTVYENLQTAIDPNFTTGYLIAGSCFGTGSNATCIASGSYFTQSNYFPLIALSSNGGWNWSYPASVYQNLTTSVDPNFTKGYLSSASCTRSTCESVCIAAGTFCKSEDCPNIFPLVALSKDKGKNWTYPADIFQNLNTRIDPNLQSALLTQTSCTGTGDEAICIATGSYTNSSVVLPLLALTQNGGNTWTYPSTIYQNLPTTIGHGFVAGLFNAGSCTGVKDKAVCIAAGTYFTKGTGLPLVAVTRDGGNVWSYPDFIYTKLRTIVDPDAKGGSFESATCTGNGKTSICMAAGSYCNSNFCFPLIAVSVNGGKNWSYPASVYSNLSTVISPDYKFGFMSDISCSGTAPHHICVASGQYSNNNNETFPLIAYSQDAGATWTYPSYIHQNLKTTIDPGFAIGSFSSTSTSGNFKFAEFFKNKKLDTRKVLENLLFMQPSLNKLPKKYQEKFKTKLMH